MAGSFENFMETSTRLIADRRTILIYKKAAAFGSYGWSGESTKVITEALKTAGFEIIDDGIKVLWQPDQEGNANCIEYGKAFVAGL